MHFSGVNGLVRKMDAVLNHPIINYIYYNQSFYEKAIIPADITPIPCIRPGKKSGSAIPYQ
jgi:hypothetical protein